MKASVEFHAPEESTLAVQVSELYTSWDNARRLWLDRVREVIKYVYATSTKETTNSTLPWSHSTVIPKLTQIHDNLGANYSSALFSNREFFTFEPAFENEASLKKRKAIVNYLATKIESSNFISTVKKCLDDWVQSGNCFGRVEYVREIDVDANGEEVVSYEGPKLFRVSYYDTVMDPTISEYKYTPKITRRVLSRGELLRMSQGPEGNDYDPAEIDKVMTLYSAVSVSKEAEVNKHIQMQLDGFSNAYEYIKSGRVELLDFIGDIYDPYTQQLFSNRLITVADRRYVIRNRPLTDYQGMGLMYHCGWRKRPDNLWGQGPLDNLVGMQYAINHLENARADAFDQMLSPDRVFIGNVEEERVGGSIYYHIDDTAGDVRNLAPDATILQADNQIALKEAQMEAYAGAPREAMGIRSPGEKTAFEVQRLEAAAGRLFQVKIEDFEREFLEPVLNGMLQVAVNNLNTPDVARVLDDDEGVVEFLTITKEDLKSRGMLRARGASHFSKRSRLVQELQAFSNVLATDPDMKVHFPPRARAKAWASALQFKDHELYVPFGALAEQVELQELQMAAQNQVDQTMAAAQDADTGIAGDGVES